MKEKGMKRRKRGEENEREEEEEKKKIKSGGADSLGASGITCSSPAADRALIGGRLATGPAGDDIGELQEA